jgi:hypothetical protein
VAVVAVAIKMYLLEVLAHLAVRAVVVVQAVLEHNLLLLEQQIKVMQVESVTYLHHTVVEAVAVQVNLAQMLTKAALVMVVRVETV